MKKNTYSRKNTSCQRADLYQQVTDKIIAALEKGVAPWRKPWRSAQHTHGNAFPVNATTGRAYSGINIPLLWMAAEENGYSSDRWLTYQQAQVAGGQVRKGESCSLAVFFKPFEKQMTGDDGTGAVDENGQPVMESLVMLKPLQLFNVAQCDGLPAAVAGSFSVQPESPVEKPLAPDAVLTRKVQKILSDTGVSFVSRRQNRAFYQPSTDRIVMPGEEQFNSEADWWSTLLHELVHSSGHHRRLNREGITSSTRKFGDPVYAFEELIAEIGSAFLCAELGIYGDVQHESYVAGWLKALREDKKALFRACRLAREASEYLLQPLNALPVQAA